MAPADSLTGRGGAAATAFAAAIVIVGLVLNGLAFFVPLDYARLGELLYPGIFALTFIANASVVVPIPYVPIIVRVANVAPSAALVVIAAAAGSMLGESVSFFIGRAGQHVLRESRITRAMERVVHRPLLAGGLLFLLAAPLNPFFDVAGLAAGALGLRYRVFAGAVFLGRCARFAVIVSVGLGFLRP